MKKAKSNKGRKKPSKKTSNKQQQEINQANANAAAAQAAAESAAAAAAAAQAATVAQASTSIVQSTAASTAASQALSSATSTNVAQSTASSQALSSATSTSVVQSTASSQTVFDNSNISALQSVVAVAAGAGGSVSISGGVSSNVAYALNGGGNSLYQATLSGDTLGAAILQNSSNLPYTINVSGVTGTRNWYITGGSTRDTYIFSSGTQLGQSVISTGGTNTDTIMFSGAASVSDSNFEKLVAGNYAVNGTNGALTISVGSTAATKGVNLITGGTSSDSITDALTGGSTIFTLVGGQGDDTYTFANVNRLGTDYITAGAGADTIVLSTDGQSIVNSAFARITGTIESLSLANGANSIVLGTSARNIGLTSVTTGAGDDYINVPVAFTNATTFSAGDGADTFVIGNTSSATFLGGNGNDTFSSAQTGVNTFMSSLVGGAGIDVLAFSGNQTSIVDGGFSNALTIETITSTGTLSAVLGSNAARAGLVTVNGSTYGDSITYQGTAAITFIGGSGDDSFTATATSASTFLGGDGGDSFAFTNSAALLAASVDGGAGSNTISFSGVSSAVDSAFTRIASGTVQALSASGTAGSSFVIGSNALAAGITSVSGSTNNDYILANYGTNAVTLSGNGGADILGGSAALATNSSNVFFSFTNLSNYTGSTMFANSAGTNVLAFSGGLTINDANFTNASNIQTVMFNGTSSIITLDGAGSTMGFTTMSAANSTGGSSFIFDTTGFSTAISFIGSSGNDTFVAKNLAGFTAATTINAGSGTDTIITGNGITTTDSLFSNIAANTMEVLNGTTGASLTIGSNAANAGINSIISGTYGVTVAASFGTGALSITGTGGTIALFRTETGNTSINAGSASSSETLLLASTGAQTLGSVLGIEVITMTAGSTLTLGAGFYQGTTGTTITTGTNASTVIGSGVLSRLTINGNSSVADTFVGGSNNDVLQGWSGAASSLVDSLTGGLGADTLVLGNGTGNFYTGTGYAFIADFGLGGSDMIRVDDYGTAVDAGAYVFGIGSGSTFTLTNADNSQIIAQGNLAGAYATATAAGLTTSLVLV
jgi:hypothetical protein